MTLRLAAFSVLALALVAAANPLVVREPLITVSVAKRVNSTGTANLVKRDRARVQALFNKNKIQPNTIVGSVPATDQAVDYTVDVQIGSPPTTYTLLVDTGSSNTWVGSRSPYVQTETSVQTPDFVHVDYGSGFMDGTEFTDRMAIGSALTIFGQSIGAATDSDGFEDVDGVLGLGPRGLTLGTLNPDGTQNIQTVTDNLFFQGVTQQNLVSISFEPSSTIGVTNGEITFGGTDASKFVGSINFAPLTASSPANTFWGIDQQIRYGSNTNILSRSAGIVDTGTTLTLLQTDAFNRYAAATGGVLDDNTGLLALTPAQFANLQSLFFIINGVTVEFTANAQIWPRALNGAIGGDSDHVFLIVSDIGNEPGINFINGMTWIERFYVVLDTTNKKVGIASTPFTKATTN